jgi:hypothetical protein
MEWMTADVDASFLAFVERSMRPHRARIWIRSAVRRSVDRRWATVSLAAFALGAPYVGHLVESDRI